MNDVSYTCTTWHEPERITEQVTRPTTNDKLLALVDAVVSIPLPPTMRGAIAPWASMHQVACLAVVLYGMLTAMWAARWAIKGGNAVLSVFGGSSSGCCTAIVGIGM